LLCLGTDNTDAQLAQIERAVSTAVAEGALGSTRVSEAASRVRILAEDLTAARDAAGPPPTAPEWPKGEAELIQTFDVDPRASDWRTRAAGRYTVVRLETDPNTAVGSTPWGPFAAAVRPELFEWGFDKLSAHSTFAAQSVCLISPERSALPSFPPDQPVLVVGRDIHQHRFAREVVDWLRSEHTDVVVVDMGWPSEDRRYADVATFGASLLMGRALLNWLARASDPAR
jgi:beta-N-acetylhexosaminidase